MIYAVSIWLLPVLIAITFHEAAHGFVALCVPKTSSGKDFVSGNLSVPHHDPFGVVQIQPEILKHGLYAELSSQNWQVTEPDKDQSPNTRGLKKPSQVR